jgi:hypothetical protein
MEDNQMVVNYLDRYYRIINNKCINGEGNIVTGDKVVKNMITIFTLSEDVCINIVKEWAERNGLEKSVSDEIKWVIPKKVYPLINREINQHIPYESKRQNRFLVNMPEEFDIQQWLIQRASRPSTRIIRNGLDGCVIEYEPMVLVCNDPIGPSLAQRLNIILRERPGEPFDFSIDLLDPTGVVIEQWVFTNCYFEAMDFGPLDMSSGDIATCTVTIRIGNMILNF